MKLINRLYLLAFVGCLLLFVGCKKSDDIVLPPSQAHFDGAADQSYAVRTATVDPYKIEVGTTDVASVDRTVTFNISSPTGAISGTQYRIDGGNTITIPAGKATALISIQGLYSGYPAGRVDTLIISLASPSIDPAGFSDTVRLAIGDICVEGVGFLLGDLNGNYANTNETFGTSPYGPYTTSILSTTSTGPTSAIIEVANIWDNGWGPISFNIDWSDPAALRTNVIPQASIPGSNAGDINATYAGQTIAVRAHPTGGPGTFSTCNNTFTLKMQLGVTGVGYFGSIYTVNLAR